ncbi:aminotransferase class I/II-fold pyridoxal phosphate-dependent enzyme [Kitasatospora sp. NPDC052896]|uniref:aminotransferase class I/II-fold pyridoxal phosphate-dependent enzyme n=1 Tax=Kitasatospora sp. NPDC052896 TaxID=3364061 RepID=UPI0037CAA510
MPVLPEPHRIRGRRAVEIAADVERAVEAGRLPPGTALPPLRELAVDLGVNANTVAAAYRTLRDRGVIETAGRRGSRVLPRPSGTSWGQVPLEVPAGVHDLSDGNPDPALLPSLTEAFAHAAAEHTRRPVRYGGSTGDERLLALARDAFTADGVPAGPLAVTSGSLDAIERLLFAHLRPGDGVACEDPGWASLFDLLPALGLRPIPMGIDDEGPRPEEAARALAAGARAFVLTSRAQNPTGAALSADRAGALSAVLARHPEVLLIDDDHGHGLVDLPYHPVCVNGGRPTTRHWAVVRSVAKAYGPDLRLALLTGDPTSLDRVQRRQRLGAGWVSHALQRAVGHLWATGAVPVDRTAASYRDRRDALLRALSEHGVRAHGRSGVHVWIPVGDEAAAVVALLGRGWAVAPGARFRLRSAPGLRLTVSTLRREHIQPLADSLAEVLHAQPDLTRRA